MIINFYINFYLSFCSNIYIYIYIYSYQTLKGKKLIIGIFKFLIYDISGGFFDFNNFSSVSSFNDTLEIFNLLIY